MKSKKIRKPISFGVCIIGILIVNALCVDAYLIYNIVQHKNVLGDSDTCPLACINRINLISGSSVTSSAKEYYVPLGSGTGVAGEWGDVTGVAAYVDTASYGRLKQVTFEATTSIPAGGQRIWVRLYNVTDKHPVWFSEMTTDTSAATLLTSQPITLDKGNKLYQVQMKTQLKISTNITQARIRITTR